MRKTFLLHLALLGGMAAMLPSSAFAQPEKSVLFLPFRDVRGQRDLMDHGWILSHYLQISLSHLGQVPGRASVEDSTQALERFSSIYRDRIDADEARRMAREMKVDHIFWGSYSLYDSGQVIRLLYFNGRSGTSAEVSASDTPDRTLVLMNRLVLELCRKLGWNLPVRPDGILERYTPGSFESFAAFSRGESAWRAERFDAAEQHFRKAVEEDRDFLAARFSLANTLVRNGKNTEARAKFQSILDSNPSFRPAGNNLGALLLTQGRTAEAWRVLNRTMRVAGTSAILEFNLGSARLEREHDLEAQDHFGKALEIKPDFAAVHYQLAVFYASRQNSGKARQSFQQARQIDRSFTEKHLQEGFRVAPIMILDLNETVYDIQFLPPRRP